MCLCARPPQIAPQTWIITLKRTTTATHQSRKPVTTQFTARSALHFTAAADKSRSTSCETSSILKGVSLLYRINSHIYLFHISYTPVPIVKSVCIFFPHLKICPKYAQTIFKVFVGPSHMTGSLRRRRRGPEAQEAPAENDPNHLHDQSEWPPRQSLTTGNDWRPVPTAAQALKGGSAHTMFHLFKPLEPCGRACK